MAGGRAPHDSRYYYDDYPADDRHRERRHHRRLRHREDADDEYWAAKRERRERRRAEEARREAELVIDEPRTRRGPYDTRPEFEPERRREHQHLPQDLSAEREARMRGSHREAPRDGTRRKKRREVVPDDRSDDYIHRRPRPEVIEEATVKRSSRRRRSDEGGSSNRTAYSPPSGSRSASLRRVEAPKLSRSTSTREPTRVHMAPRPLLRRTSTVKLATAAATPIPRTQSVSHHQRRSTGGLLATLFGPPPRHSATILHKEAPRVECLVCMNDDLPRSRTAKLGCGHRMCHSCLKRQFSLSVNDPQHMPPRCCTSEHIPLRYVERLFDDKFKRTWNKKYQEYTTANRLYCPTKECGEWIKPSKIRMDMTYGRKYARCGSCHTKVCATCNSKFHTRRECPRDPETNRIVEMAKAKGWQRCYNCRALVELKEGCNHMTCRCTAQFCMVCAAPWKTCNCPWFNYQHLDDDDRLNDMRVPRQNIVEVIEMPAIEIPSEPAPPPARRASTRIRHRGDRGLDRAGEALAAHLQTQLTLDGSRTPSDMLRNDSGVQVYGLGNSGGHHMNDSYAVRPLAAAAPSNPPPAPRLSNRRPSVRETPHAPPPTIARASTMAGLSRDGSKRGANRVGTWLSHIQLDPDAVHTAPRNVEVDDWRIEGSMVGID